MFVPSANIACLSLKVAAVIHRFGKDIVGGENLAFHVLARLHPRLDVTVVTTCARDYVSWENHYAAGQSLEGNLKVIRFPVVFRRPVRTFRMLSRIVLQRRLRGLTIPSSLETLWISLQGPYCPALIEFLRQNRYSFDAFLFYTYLYYPVVRGLPLASDRSILIPTAHDERPIYLRTYRNVFGNASALIYLTLEEQEFANRHFAIGRKPQRVAAMGVRNLDDCPDLPSSARIQEFRTRHALGQPYFLYVGRVDVAKGVKTMFSYFLRYVSQEARDCLLVLAGSRAVGTGIPVSDRIRYLGYLTEEEKRAAMLGSVGLLLFSPYESLSIVLLEALGLGRPAIVTNESAVLAGHMARSGAGFAVGDYGEFRVAADQLFTSGDALGKRGFRYVKENFDWRQVESAYLDLIETVSGRQGSPPPGDADT